MDLAPVQEKGENVKRPGEFGESVFRGSYSARTRSWVDGLEGGGGGGVLV
jgi:hypothetical protein